MLHGAVWTLDPPWQRYCWNYLNVTNEDPIWENNQVPAALGVKTPH